MDEKKLKKYARPALLVGAVLLVASGNIAAVPWTATLALEALAGSAAAVVAADVIVDAIEKKDKENEM